MPDIFRAGIAKEINKGLGSLVFDAVLTKSRPSTRGDLTGGVNSVTTEYKGKGFVDDYENSRIDGTIIQVGDRKVVLLGASFSVKPETDDTVLIEGDTWTIVRVTRDPAGATYECQAR